MKTNKIILAIIFLGVLTLFFFPEPETNFLAYFGTALFFITLVVVLLIKRDKKTKS